MEKYIIKFPYDGFQMEATVDLTTAFQIAEMAGVGWVEEVGEEFRLYSTEAEMLYTPDDYSGKIYRIEES